MKLDIYVNYNGKCREAFSYYEEHLGGKIIMMQTFAQMPAAANIPEERKNDILHARIEIGGTTVMGADIPNAEPMRSAYLTLGFSSAEEAEKTYTILSEGGEIFMQMAETNFANRFAMLRDKFGANWMLLYQKQSGQ